MEQIYLDRIEIRDREEMAGLLPHLINSHLEL